MSDPRDDVTQARLERLAKGGIPEAVIPLTDPWDLPATYMLTKPTFTPTIDSDTINAITRFNTTPWHMRTKRKPPLKRRWKRTFPKLGR